MWKDWTDEPVFSWLGQTFWNLAFFWTLKWNIPLNFYLNCYSKWPSYFNVSAIAVWLTSFLFFAFVNFLLLCLIIPSQQSWRGYSNRAVRGWLGEWVSGFVGAWFRHALPCGHNSNYSFCPITFKLHMHICHDERRNPIDFESRGQRSRSTLALCT